MENLNTINVIKDKKIKKYIKQYCIIDNEYNIVSKTSRAFIDSIPWIRLMDTDCSRSILNVLVKHGINEVYAYRDFRKTQKSATACCGFSEKEQKWYGWTQRGIRSFGIGDSYFGSKKAETLEDCKKLAYRAVQALGC